MNLNEIDRGKKLTDDFIEKNNYKKEINDEEIIFIPISQKHALIPHSVIIKRGEHYVLETSDGLELKIEYENHFIALMAVLLGVFIY